MHSTYVAFYEDGRSTFSELAVYFGSVPSEHLGTLDERFKAAIQRIVAEGLDMDRMSSVITRDRLKVGTTFSTDGGDVDIPAQLRSALENHGGDVFSRVIISDFIYGDSQGGDLQKGLAEHYETVKTWTSKQWTDILSKYYDAPDRLVIRGKPSASLADKLEMEEKARVAAQVKRLGPGGLAELEKKLAAAKDEHDQPIPEEVLTNFPVPDVKGISWISVQSANNAPSSGLPAGLQTQKFVRTDSSELERHLQKDSTSLTMQVQFDHVVVCRLYYSHMGSMLMHQQSDFTSIHVLMSLANLPVELKP